MTSEQSNSSESFLARRGLILIALGAIFGGVILFILFAILLFSPGDDAAEDDGVVDDDDAIALVPLGDPVVVNVLSESGTISLTLETPAFLNISGEEFTVQTQQLVNTEEWQLLTQDETTAVWAYGSVINYIFGLVDSAENRALLDQLVLGDEIILTTKAGVSYTFTFSSREQVDRENQDVFAQHSPGVTIVLADGEGEERLVVRGRYVVSDAGTQVDDAAIVELGETAQLENLQVTVTGATHQLDRPEIPSGFAFYLVDFTVRNVGNTALDAGRLNFVLADELGNLYALNQTASQLGNNRPLSGPLSPGQTIAATAGYQIPAQLSSPVLRWLVSNLNSNSQIQVNIPFQDGSGGQGQAAVQLQQAEVSIDGTSLLIFGQITNLADQPLIVQETDVTLSEGGTVYLIFSNNPGFPWVISAGQTVPFAVTFQRPVGSSAIFEVAGQPFQFNGLR